MKATIAGQAYECARAVRTENAATLHLTDGGTVEFSGVSDFSPFLLEGGDWETAELEPTQLDVIEAQAAYTAMMTGTLLEV